MTIAGFTCLVPLFFVNEYLAVSFREHRRF